MNARNSDIVSEFRAEQEASNRKLTKSINAIGDAIETFQAKAQSTLDDVRDTTAALQDRIEEIESRQGQPGKTGAGGNSASREHVKRFEAWLRAPKSDEARNALGEMERRLNLEGKAMSTGTGADGGFAVPEEISREIERLELEFSPVRSLVKVERTSSGDYKKIVNIRGAAAGWVGESGTRSETATSQLREVSPTFGELYAYPKTSEWALDDVFFNMSEWLAEEVAQQFAQLEGASVISGNGSTKPTGMLNTTPVATADFASPLRAAAAYEFVPCLSPSSPAVAEVTGDCLIDLVYALRSQYRARATWIMNSLTARNVRKLKDAEGNYLWAPGLAAGQPDRLLGYPVATWEQMPDIGTNNFPIGFGDWRRAYVLVDRTDLRITVDQVTEPGQVKFYVRRRVGGHVANNDSGKFLRTTIA